MASGYVLFGVDRGEQILQSMMLLRVLSVIRLKTINPFKKGIGKIHA